MPDKDRGKRKLTPGEELAVYVPDLPSPAAARLTRLIMRLSTIGCPAKVHYDFDKREMKGRQVLILAQHASGDDPYYVNVAYPFIDPNAIMSKHNVLIPVMYKLLLKDGVILKSLYEPDLSAMRYIMKLHKRGASFLLFPEGVQSTDGSTQPLHPATARLIKKLGLDTVLCTSHGAYLSQPRFDTYKRKGRIEYNFEILYTKEEVQEMSEEELYGRLLEKFRYNDFDWNSKRQYSYKGKVPCAHGIDNLLFTCPRCGRRFTMHVEGERLLCECGSAVTIDDRYNLIPDEEDFPFKRLDEWTRWQQDVLAEEVSREGFLHEEEVTYRTLNNGDLSKGRYVTLGEGRVEIDRDRFRYIGTRNGEDVDLRFEIARLPSATINPGMANQIYYDGVYHQFAPKGGNGHAIMIMMTVEALHDMGDPERRKAREDTQWS